AARPEGHPPGNLFGPTHHHTFQARGPAGSPCGPPQCLPVFDFGRHLRASSETDGAAIAINFLTMELLRGETLAKHLDRIGCMATDEALPVIQQMVEALAAAHKVGVIHRDFKPSNVILVPTASNDDLRASKMRAVVTDFGLARSAPVGELSALETAQSSLTDTGQLMGTISYMSPEQLEGGE